MGEVLDLMHPLAERRQTMLIVTHEMQFARKIADRVIYIGGGRIVEQGPPARLFDAPPDRRSECFLREIGRSVPLAPLSAVETTERI